jgi:hypothetical protein
MCSYCGCQSLTVIGRLTDEHVAIIEAAGVFRRTALTAGADAARGAGTALTHLLRPHTRGEEGGLFAELAQVDGFGDHVASLCAEHVDLDDDLGAILGGDLDRLDPFVSRLHRHIDREENGLFPAAAIALDADVLQRLGDMVDQSDGA